jgi:predicted site-specific integrase-resolvase
VVEHRHAPTIATYKEEAMATAILQRAAIYARVSTTNHGQDVTLQTRELREYCERRGWQIVGEYVDTGISGAKDRRPELDRLMADAHKSASTLSRFGSLIGSPAASPIFCGR